MHAKLIMVIDDSQTSRKILDVVLQREGYRVVTFADPLQAIKALQNNEMPDMFFIDIHLPVVNGIDLIRRLRYKGITAPIFAMSGQSGIFPSLRAKLAGAQEYIPKPFNTHKITDLVRAAFERSHQ